MTNNSNGTYSQANTPVTTVHTNLDQDIIEITEDRLRLVLNNHLEQVEKKNGWATPLGILITIVLTITTADFKDAYNVKSPTWQAIFIITALLSTAWLIRTVYIAIISPSVDDVVEKIKKKS